MAVRRVLPGKQKKEFLGARNGRYLNLGSVLVYHKCMYVKSHQDGPLRRFYWFFFQDFIYLPERDERELTER